MTLRRIGAVVALCALLLSGCMQKVSDSTLTGIQQAVSDAAPDAVSVSVQHNSRPGINASRIEVYLTIADAELSPTALHEVLVAIDDSAPHDVSVPIAILLRVSATESWRGDLGDIESPADAVGFTAGVSVGHELMFYRKELTDYVESK